MKGPLTLDEAMLAEAIGYAGAKKTAARLHEGLRTLVHREAAAQLCALGGKDRRAVAGRRRRTRGATGL